MTALYTASWSTLHRHRDRLNVRPVRISRGVPKFWPEAADFPALDDLMPDGWMLSINDLEKFGRAYRRKLHVIGFERIHAQLDQLAAECGRPLALACFEADCNTCHRGPAFGFAAWWLGQCGELVAEWEPPAAQMSFDVQTTVSNVGHREG